jgi:intracellular sulfur oxidation DsrE/DsrF family protein
MYKSTVLLLCILILSVTHFRGQDKKHPVIKDFGGIYDISEATVRPEPGLNYKVVIDVYSGPKSADKLNPALNNVARMMNLHAIGGATKQMDIVLAIHGAANDVVMGNEHYFARHNVNNPNIDLIKSLKAAGVKLTVCGQSLLARKVAPGQVLEEVDIATSMLTTVTTYQLKGYAFLKF